MLDGLEDPERGAERTALPEQSLQLVVAEGGLFREDERDILGNPERGETRPPPGVHAFVLRGTLHVVCVGRGSAGIRTRIRVAGGRLRLRRGDRAERGAKEDRECDAEDDLGRKLRHGVEVEQHDGRHYEGAGEGRKDRPRLHRADCGGLGCGVTVTYRVHAVIVLVARVPGYGAQCPTGPAHNPIRGFVEDSPQNGPGQ